MDIRSQGQWVGRTLLFALVGACGDGGGGGVKQISYNGSRPDGAAGAGYVRVDLVADDDDADAENVDENLVNAWGIAYGPETPFWVANEGSGTATAYSGAGVTEFDPVRMPTGARSVTGLVFNDGDGFEVGPANARVPAQLIFATEEGALVGWSPDLRPSTEAVVAVEAPDEGSAYKGLAIAETDDGTFLYAANFEAGRIDVFDEDFAPIVLDDEAFVDPDLPENYVPFGIQTLEDRIYVTYAQADEDREDEVAGPGKGYVSVFEPDGTFIERVASQGTLNAPWGVVLAPESFGQFGGALLVGNFGDGRINAYDADSFEFLGQLEDARGEPIAIDGLWGLVFGNDEEAGSSRVLYFTAGPDDEEHGLFGRIEVARRTSR